MLMGLNGREIMHECNNCQNAQMIDLTGITLEFIEEFGEYENLIVPCSECNSLEVFNMNLDLNETNEDALQDNQRNVIKDLMRELRPDL